MDRAEKTKIRLFVDHPLGAGQSVPLSREQAHYLFGVMRLSVGASLKVFDGKTGEWLAQVAEAGKRGGTLVLVEHLRPLKNPPDLWLLFAPVKKARTDFIVEKAVEMGAAIIQPVQTDYTNSGRIQRQRLQAHAMEAAEQCGATSVPSIEEMVRLDRLLDAWDATRQIMFCDESETGSKPLLPELPGPWSILIGPEGGFSERERKRLRGLNHAHPVALGPRVLRAETAAVAAMAIWQNAFGDWR